MFTFFRQTNGERREVQIRSSDLTVQRLATVFKLSTQALYLEEEFSGRAEFPSERGTFNTTAWEQNATFRVEGETSSASFNTEVASTSSASASGSLNRTFPTSSQFRSVILVGRSNSRTPSPGVTQQYATPTTAKKSIRKSVALCKPKILRGKIVLDEVISTHFVSFTEEQASTAEIAEMVSSQVENEAAVTLVDSKFSEVPETATG